MPSAANIKVDKQIASETASVDSASNQNNTPIRQAIVIIEHKIRNLEKRKAKLESYKELQASGKDLNQDQRIAVAKYDEVVQTLEFARDLCKQFQGIAVVSDKEAKKIARKETAARSQAEIAKVREVLLVQDALQQLGQDNVREDFLLGRNGAVTLSETDLKILDNIYPEVTPKHEVGAPNFTNQVQSAAEHLIAIVDGKPKDAFESSYSHIKEIIGKIHESGYLDQAEENNVHEYVEEVQEPILEPEPQTEPISEPLLEPPTVYQIDPVAEEVPIAAPILETPSQSQPAPVQSQVPPQSQPQSQPPAQPQVQPQPAAFYQATQRPISEVLGTGTFFFLQDSELDSPEQPQNQNPGPIPSQIPSQTFTNQNFVNVNPIAAGYQGNNPPPPIPMPPSHPLGMEFAGVPPIQYGTYQQSPIPEEIPQQPLAHSEVVTVTHNGDNSLTKTTDEPNTGSPKNGPRPPRNPHNNPRRNGPQQPGYHQHQQHQSYYNNNNNNNGYSNNRPRRGQVQGQAGQGPTRSKPKPAQH